MPTKTKQRYRIRKDGNDIILHGKRYGPGDEVALTEEEYASAARILEPVDDPPMVDDPPPEDKKPKATKAAKPTGDTPSKDSPE